MGTRWEYRLVENYQQPDETKAQSMLRWTNANAREGWEFDQVIDFGDSEHAQLLFKRLISN